MGSQTLNVSIGLKRGRVYLGISDFSDDLACNASYAIAIMAITQEDYQLLCMTALWDAIGHTVTQLEAEVGKEVKKTTGASVVVVVKFTDGHECHITALDLNQRSKNSSITNHHWS